MASNCLHPVTRLKKIKNIGILFSFFTFWDFIFITFEKDQLEIVLKVYCYFYPLNPDPNRFWYGPGSGSASWCVSSLVQIDTKTQNTSSNPRRSKKSNLREKTQTLAALYSPHQCCGAEARLFSWSRSRWKSSGSGSGSGLLLFGLGVLWQSSDTLTCKI